jgi:excisionase family DNA binding protein
MPKHRPKWHRIKVHRNYDVAQAAQILGVAKGTIRRWLKHDGLESISSRKPALIHGTTLKAFGQARFKITVKCKLHEFFCFSCKAPELAAGNMADYVARTAKSGNLKAICSICETIMNKHVSTVNLPALAKFLDISIRHASEHLVECPKTC